MSFTREAQYITECALRHESHIVTLGPLVFFSTVAGDAWVLDPEDHLARPLAVAGVAQLTGITETPETFSVDWNMTYSIAADTFGFRDASGAEYSVVGYPIRDISRAICRVQKVR